METIFIITDNVSVKMVSHSEGITIYKE